MRINVTTPNYETIFTDALIGWITHLNASVEGGTGIYVARFMMMEGGAIRLYGNMEIKRRGRDDEK